MLVTTTSTIEGKNIKEYKGLVFGEEVNGIAYSKDFAASFTNILGGRSKEYEEEIMISRADVLDEMIRKS